MMMAGEDATLWPRALEWRVAEVPDAANSRCRAEKFAD